MPRQLPATSLFKKEYRFGLDFSYECNKGRPYARLKNEMKTSHLLANNPTIYNEEYIASGDIDQNGINSIMDIISLINIILEA